MSAEFEATFESILAHHKPRPKRKYWPDGYISLELQGEVLTDFDEWATPREIAIRHGMSHQAIHHRLKRMPPGVMEQRKSDNAGAGRPGCEWRVKRG